MSAPLRVRRVEVFPLAVPMRLAFEHAAATRSTADPVLVRLSAEAPYAERCGWGETLARAYVTGETAETVAADVGAIFAPRLLEFRPASFAQALEFIDTLPSAAADGRVIQAARAAVELALLDLAGRAFGRSVQELAGWLDLPGFGSGGCLRRVRYSGIVVGRSAAGLKFALRAQRFYGLRDFKLKVAVPGWEQRAAWAAEVLRGGLKAGRCTLRADANGGWTRAQARTALPLVAACGVSALEQPLAAGDAEGWAELAAAARAAGCDLIADESLVTMDDALRLVQGGDAQVLNIRIAKVGGLLPALRMARMALAAGRDVQLGCLVGETSVLSAAGVAFLSLCPQVRFVEGAFGRWLLKRDIARPVVQFGFGGRVRGPRGAGLGVEVDGAAVRDLATAPVAPIQF